MALAINDAGAVLTDAGGKWLPATRAVNDTTGESLVLDGGAWKPVAGLKAPPTADAASAPTFDTEYGPTPTTTSAPEPSGAPADISTTIRNALAPAPNTTYGDILPLAKDETTGVIRPALPNIIRSPLIGLTQEGGQSTINPDTGTIGIPPEAAAVAQFAASPLRFGGAALADAAIAPSTITAREVQARDGVGMMEAWRRAHAENTAAPAESIAAIGSASDINGAIAAAGTAAEKPSGGATAAGILDALDTQAAAAGWRRMQSNEPLMPGQEVATGEGGRQYVRDTSATVESPEPQSAGAAASREGTAPSLIEEVTPAQKATALQKMVNQSAEDRLTPQGRDDNVYVEGVQRPESMKDFSPAAEGNISSALAHKTDYYMDSNYRGQHDAIVKENNNVMRDRLDALFGDANARDAAMEQAKELMPGPVGLFNDQRPVNAQPIVDEIRDILASPAGKRDAVESQMNAILPKLMDANGNLETMPSMLKGVRDNITDKLYDKSPTVEGNAARTARNQLRDVLSVVDQTIADGLPGTKYQDYLANLSTALGQVSKLDFLQRYITGTKKLTDLSGNLLFNKVQTLLNDIQAHHADQTGGAKELTMPEINQIEAVRNELAAKDLLDRRSRVPGSNTAQVQNAAGILGSGPLGTAVKGAGEVALHAGLAATTGGIGNAALAGYRFIVKPAMDASKLQQEAAAAAMRKARLLDTTPRPDAAP